jgi:hypothetical protein
MNDTAIVTKGLLALKERTGLFGAWKASIADIDGEISFVFEGKTLKLFAEIKKEVRSVQLPLILEMAKKHQPLIVVAERIFPQIKETLREHKINYLDGAGNIYLNTPHQLIWIDGNKHTEAEKPVTNRAFTKTGLKTVFYLLLGENNINLSYRDLAKATNVALGNINNIVTGLKEAGFIISVNDKEMLLQNKKALLDRWIAGYRETLKPSLFIGSFRFLKNENFTNWQNLAVSPGETIWGGEPAADLITNYLNPEVLTIYTSEKKAALMPKWKLLPDEAGNIKVYEKFWNDSDSDKRPYAPALLIYADLIITDDSRCIETAQRIYNQYLKDEFERY